MHRRKSIPIVALSLALAAGSVHAWLAEFGIEGMGVVSTRADETSAAIAPDGSRIVWSTDRDGGAGGSDLWHAVLEEKRWQKANPLPFNTADDEADPAFAPDGRWLYFASARPGGQGGTDLYRVPVGRDGRPGTPENLGPGINSAGDERAPRLLADGRTLIFSSNGRGRAGGHDLFAARWNGTRFADPAPLPGVNTRSDETDAAVLHGGRALLFARSPDLRTAPVRLWLAHCDGRRFGEASPWALSFNTPEGRTRGATVDAGKPSELLASGSARAPRAGGADLYRMRVPSTTGVPGCL